MILNAHQGEFYVALVAPPCAPGVADDPVPFLVIYANDLHSVIGVSIWIAREYSAFVGAHGRRIDSDNKSAPVENVLDNVLLSFHSVVASHGDEVVVFHCIALSGSDVVGVRAILCYATSLSNGTESSEVGATVATWHSISAEVHMSDQKRFVVSGILSVRYGIILEVQSVLEYGRHATYR